MHQSVIEGDSLWESVSPSSPCPGIGDNGCMAPPRPHKTYDHRLRDLVRDTDDLTVAAEIGVPRSTAQRSVDRYRETRLVPAFSFSLRPDTVGLLRFYPRTHLA